MPELKIEYVPVSEIVEAEFNPKLHDDRRIGTSIDEFGLFDSMIRDDRTGRLVAGHGRLHNLRDRLDKGETPPDGILVDAEGRWLAPVQVGWSSRSDAQAKAVLVIDNHHPSVAGWDHVGLSKLLEDVPDDLRDIVAFDQDALDDLIRANTPPSLDDLADELGDPDPSDTWPIIRFAVPPEVRAAWQSYLEASGLDEHEAFGRLLESEHG
jgi:hypothetical protein